jgi:hypothetical protein
LNHLSEAFGGVEVGPKVAEPRKHAFTKKGFARLAIALKAVPVLATLWSTDVARI